MLDLPFFWIGPLGGLMPMACPETGVSTELVVSGDVKQTINGRQTHDINSYRRRWSIEQGFLDPTDYAFIETMFATGHDRTMRFIDPLITNRARLFASMSSNFVGYAGAKDAWKLSVGTGIAFNLGDWPAITFTSQGDARAMSYQGARYVLWSPTASATLSVNGTVTAGSVNLKAIDAARVGEVLTFSAWIKTTGTASVSIRLTGVDATGLLTTNASSSALTSVGSWTRISATYTVPAGSVGVFPQFVTTSTSGTIAIAGLMINTGATPLPFVRGGGGSEALIASLSGASNRYPLVSTNMEITEV